MRGKVDEKVLCTGVVRITPAHAGKRSTVYPAIYQEKDHPRTCGEKWLLSPVLRSLVGSPPHMRGKAIFSVDTALNVRITPAHAGKSISESRSVKFRQDHPRTCGEKTTKNSTKIATAGSPPHMRGKAFRQICTSS